MSRPWTLREIEVLRTFAPLGTAGVAEILERTESSVARKAGELKVSLKTENVDIDLGLLPDRLILWVRESPTLRLCPMCGRRLASMKKTGLCRPCHLDRLIDIRREQLEVLARERRLTKLRQDKKRLRICDRCGKDFYPRATSKEDYCPNCSERNV